MEIVITTSNEQRKQTIDNLLEPHIEATYSFEIALSAVYFLVILQYKSEKVTRSYSSRILSTTQGVPYSSESINKYTTTQFPRQRAKKK